MCRGISGLDQLDPEQVTQVALRVMAAASVRGRDLELVR
jgi:hypothetical protein